MSSSEIDFLDHSAPIEYNAQGRPKPRGQRVMTYEGTLIEHYAPYLAALIRDTGGINGALGVQYVVNQGIRYPDELSRLTDRDSLHEGDYERAAVPYLVYNYRGGITPEGICHFGRALLTVTSNCAANCVFCTRGDIVGQYRSAYKKNHPDDPRALAERGMMTREDVDRVLDFYRADPWLNEVIISGGDFMIAPKELFRYVVEGFARLQNETKYNPDLGQDVPVVDTVRIGTRAPFQNPKLIDKERVDILRSLRNPNFMFHINHAPYELTPQALEVVDQLLDIPGANGYSQSVFLRGVNAVLKPGVLPHEQDLVFRQVAAPDGRMINVPVEDRTIDKNATVQHLIHHFNLIKHHNIIPYYLFQNDAVNWAVPLTVPALQGIDIWQSVTPHLSGLANTVQYVFDNGHGKVAVPKTALIGAHESGYYDYRGHFVPYGTPVEG